MTSQLKIYENPGFVYKITNTDENKTYIGSTFSTLSTRFSSHKSDYKRYKNENYGFNSVFGIFDEFGIDNCEIDLVEEKEYCN